ncbi:PREDICTED: putative ribosome-binding factor A, mitochondrial [Myotis davidii]|uniref:Putative ribosome-binding factor A, mitochondrial n=1 Tax=Myotis davidii TaxID=225400 RepID=L5LZ04_MYODS|nr:PREDICTED: putative ribosome-binding factor A, mitochondrial [Myotis davidii]ELK31654.1 Putative ribosome-binding factor A, mitochondrial [Myotis davidii]
MWVAARGLWGYPAGLWTVFGGRKAGLLPGGVRDLHGSPVSCGKNLLKKFASKTKKKFWYEGPSLGSHLTYKPSKLELLTKSTSKKTRKEDHVRLRALNGLLYKALSDLLCSPEVSQEIYDLNVELSKVSLTSDFSACRVYWRTTGSAEQNAHTQDTLKRFSAHMRHLLLSQQTLKNMPPIVFVQDKQHAALAEVDRLLAVADFGPPDEQEDLTQSDFRDPEAPDAPSPCDALGPAVHSSLYGIDHEALNKQIMEYKKRKEKGHRGEGPAWLGPEQVAELTRQMTRRKKGKPRVDDDLSPKNYPWGLVSEDDLDDDGGLQEEFTPVQEWELREAEQELKAERGGDRKD